jgi:Spy/CpxP family protein refolding chaperone
MRKQISCLALLAFSGLTMFAMPQEQQQQAPAASASQAQTEGHRQFDPNRQVRQMTKKLNLTADQQQQLLPILTERNQQMQAIRNDSSLSQQDRHAKMLSVREDSQNKIKALLTPDQQKAYDQMQQQARERHQNKRAQGADSDTNGK